MNARDKKLLAKSGFVQRLRIDAIPVSHLGQEIHKVFPNCQD